MALSTTATTTSPTVTPVLSHPPWTQALDKLFEKALAIYAEDSPDRWEKISEMVPGVDCAEAERHYGRLVEDFNSIETGKIELPKYGDVLVTSSSSDEDSSIERKSSGAGYGTSPGVSGGGSGNGGGGSKGSSSKSSDPERRKGIPWSEEEHRLFLLGLAKFGKGDWRSISRNFVISRTPTQVASHAQKYFIRLNSINKDKRRSSIHDITNVNHDGEALPQSPGPITGIPSPPSVQWPRAGLHAGGVYDMGMMGPHVDPMRGHMIMAPSPHPHHVPYGHVPVKQPSQMTMQHMTYAMPQSANA